MTFQGAVNRADWLAQVTGRTQYVVGNGLGHFWVTEKLDRLPSGESVRPYVTVSQPHEVRDSTPEDAEYWARRNALKARRPPHD